MLRMKRTPRIAAAIMIALVMPVPARPLQARNNPRETRAMKPSSKKISRLSQEVPMFVRTRRARKGW